MSASSYSRCHRHLRNIEVKSFTGLVVDFARKEQAKVLVRGIRAVTDF
jgi:pantetheine-phosphate adenylyltransferase